MSKATRRWVAALASALLAVPVLGASGAIAAGEPLAGTVTDAATGQPLAGATVTLCRSSQPGFPPFTAGSTTTDASGAWAMTAANGSYLVRFTKAGYLGEAYDNQPLPSYVSDPCSYTGGTTVAVDSAAPKALTADLVKQAALTGKILNADGTAFLGTVSAPTPNGFDFNAPATVAPDGSFVKTVTGAGTYLIQLHPLSGFDEYLPGVVDQSAATQYTVAAGSSTDIGTVTLLSGGVVGGTITDPSGQPVAGATVTVTSKATPLSTASAHVQSAADGSYRLANVPPGVYSVDATAAGFVDTFTGGTFAPDPSHYVTASVGQTVSADVVLHRPGNVHVHVTDPSGGALAGVYIQPQIPGAVAGLLSVPTDANGDAVLNVAPTGIEVFASAWYPSPYLSEYYKDAYVESLATRVPVSEGGDVAITMSLNLPGSISGVVTDDHGAPVVGTAVRLWSDGSMVNYAQTDSTGAYQFTGVGPQAYIVQADGSGALASTYFGQVSDPLGATPVTAVSNADTPNINIQLRQGATLNARIVDTAGNPVAKPYVNVLFCFAPAVPSASVVSNPVTSLTSECSPYGADSSGTSFISGPSADGNYSITGLGAGNYNVAGVAGDTYNPGPHSLSQIIPLTLAAGDVVTCTFVIGGTSTCSTGSTGPHDHDGVADATEDAVNAAGDGNGDGIKDSTQDNVASLPSPAGGYVTIAGPSGTLLSSVTVDPNPGNAGLPPGGSVSSGLVGYNLAGVAPGAAASVDIYFASAPTANAYAKLVNGVWTKFAAQAATIAQVGARTRVTLMLTDGGPGDLDGQKNGTIVDPGALLSLDVTPPTLTCVSGAPILLNQAGATVSATVSDSGSGPVAATVTAPVPTKSIGTQNVGLTGADKAGNTASIVCPVVVGVRFDTFIPPTDPRHPNRVRAGSDVLVLVLWRIVDAKGKAVAAPAFFMGIVTAPGCAPATVGSPRPATVSPLLYIGNGIWATVWKTDRTMSGCRTLTLNYVGGSATATYLFV